jgi:excisionase family DNA binding protein
MSAPTSTVDRLAYSPGDAAAALGVARSHVYELLARGELHGRKIGRRTVILHDELVRYLDSRPAYETD